MPKKTLAQRVIRYLEDRGSKREMGRSHYIQLSRPGNPDSHYFVGKNGAVRVGRCASETFSVTESIHRQMWVWEKKEKDNV
jgi:hypothetical protein